MICAAFILIKSELMKALFSYARKCKRWIHDRSELYWYRLSGKSSDFKILGQRGENAAARLLASNGMIVLERNCRSRLGEIDLIAVENRTIVFVEVKTRKTGSKGDPLEAIDRTKQYKITRLALNWLKLHNLLEKRFRFDAVSVVWPDPNRLPSVIHYENVFEPMGAYQMFT